jgi:hypothetical protein
MAISTSTEALISLYQQKVESDTEQIQQVIYTENGFTTTLSNGEEFKLYGVQETLDYFDAPIKKIDNKIVEINAKIVGLQNTILDVGQSANDCGCGGATGFNTSGTFPFTYTPFFLGINTITVYADTIPYRGYSYTSPNPFSEINGNLTSVNVGIGTEDLVGQSSLGVYYGNVGIARTTLPICPGVTDCTGYATSITNLTSQITPLQTERNDLITKVNYLKKERSRFEIRKYGFDRQKEELNAEIATSNTIISFFQDPANEEWL